MGNPKKTTGRLKAPAAQYPVPQSRDECVQAIALIGQAQRERQRIEAAMNDELAAVRQRFEAQAAPHGDTIKGLSAAVQVWCEANRQKLTQDGKTKTASLASGEVSWRLTPPSVKVTGEAAVIDELHRLGLEQFIRTKEGVNKEAVLNDPDSVRQVKGISIAQREDFIVKPFETELEEVL